MDPLYEGKPPDEQGLCPVTPDGSVCLYFELRGPAHGARCLLVNGMFGTLRHYDELRDRLADEAGFQVLTYNFRHVGASRHGPAEPVTPNQTSDLLAADSLALVEAKWPGGEPVHLYGASMGGFVVPKLALLLLERGRLGSLYIACSCRGLRWAPPLNTWCFKHLLKFTMKPGSVMAPKMVRDSFSKEYLDTASDDPRAGGATMGELWTRRWGERFGELFCLDTLDVCAGQAPVAMRHWLSDAEAERLRASGAPIAVYIARRDTMISPAAQAQLAQLLGARTLDTNSAHMEANFEGFEQLTKQVAAAAAQQQQQQAQAGAAPATAQADAAA